MRLVFLHFLVASFLWLLPNIAQAAEDAFEEKVRAYILRNPEIIVEALTILSERERAAELSARISSHDHLFDRSSVLGFGREDAPIRVVEFFDYKCAPCKALHPQLVKAVSAHPELRIEMRHLPILTPASERAARFALAVREVASGAVYRQVHDLLWSHNGPLNKIFLAKIAEQVGLSYAQLETQMYEDAITDRITAHRDTAIALEIIGTPAFVTAASVSVGPGDVAALIDDWLNQ